MKYRVQRDESVTKAVRRIARKLAGNTRQALVDPTDPGERVHDARTAVKKLRALLLLAQPALGKRQDSEDRKLRKLGKKLSTLRDAQVLIDTFDRLYAQFDGRRAPSLRGVRASLTTRLQNVEREVDMPARLARADQSFKKLRKRARRWRLASSRSDRAGAGWDALAGGLRDTYRQARKAMRAAYRGDHEDPSRAFHDWRKAVKYHGHHMRLLADVAPRLVQPRLDALDHLGDLLGEEHDLTVFAQTMRDEPGDFQGGADRQALEAHLVRRQARLRDEARPLGEQLFAESSGDFTRRFERHWRRWRRAGQPRQPRPHPLTQEAPPQSTGAGEPPSPVVVH